MRKLFALLVVALGLVALTAAPATAITGNYVKDNDHPFVGLAVFYDDAEEFSHRCSGSLLSSTVFLTAGHCTDGVTTARVYFQQDAGAHYDPELGYDPNTGYPESCIPTDEPLCVTSDELYNYGFNEFEGFPDTRDLGLIILDQPVNLSEYGELTAVGSLDKLATRRGMQDVTFRVSGYGVTEKNPVKTVSFRERLQATSKLVNTRSALTDGFNLQTSGNRGGDRGGTCSGDSGGPVFYPANTNVIVGVTSFGLNEWCRGTDFAYRIDTQAVHDWIRQTIGEAAWNEITIAS